MGDYWDEAVLLREIFEKLSSQRIILASSSPRRKDILHGIGLKIEVLPSTFEENLEPSMFPNLEAFVIETCFQKGQEVAERIQKRGEKAELIIAADTIVALDGKVYGKPGTDSVARDMLQKLSGKPHQVLTGVTLMWSGYSPSNSSVESANFLDKFCEVTDVHMASLNDDIISSYIQTQEPLDKAGAYGIQGIGGCLVEKINGDFYNVAGFPLHRFCQYVNRHYNLQE